MKLSKLLWLPLKVTGGFLVLLILYFVSALVLSRIAVNSDFAESDQNTIEIYIQTNGVHTDLVLPYRNELKDWSKVVNSSATRSRDTTFQFISFGWGDKGFYLDTKTWDDLKAKTAFNALFYLGSAAMHVTFYKKMHLDASSRRIRVSQEQYKKLVDYISDTFYKDKSGHAVQIEGAAYDNNDSFYEAKGKYGLFFTCNTWTNDGLKTAGLKACLWTPFDKGILQLYDK